MNEQLQQALADVIIGASETMGQAKDLLISELPDVAQQALLYYGVYYALTAAVGMFILITLVVVWVKYSGCAEYDGVSPRKWTLTHDDDGAVSPHVMGTVLLTGVLVTIVCEKLFNLTWLKIWIAPKLWLIEYAGSLVK